MNRDECILIEVTFKRNLNGQEQSFEYGNVLIACTPCKEPEAIVNRSAGILCHFPIMCQSWTEIMLGITNTLCHVWIDQWAKSTFQLFLGESRLPHFLQTTIHLHQN